MCNSHMVFAGGFLFLFINVKVPRHTLMLLMSFGCFTYKS